MKALKFESDLLASTDRYSKDLSLPDYIYGDDGFLDRKKTAELLLSEEYGYVNTEGIDIEVTESDEPPSVIADPADYKKHVKLNFKLTKEGRSASFPVDLFLPDVNGDIPFVIYLSFTIWVEKNYFPLKLIMDKNVAVARIFYIDVAGDDNDFEKGIAPLVSDRNAPHSAGKLSIWAYAASLVGSYLIDKGYAKKEDLYVTGHSRLGKTALLAAALYDCFAGVHSNNSGCCGVAISREKHGETIEDIVNKFPYWFTPEFAKYANRENEMPFDQHYLMALVAPKKLSVSAAEEDTWADTEAQYLSAEAASVIYEKHGLVGLDRSKGLLRIGENSTGGNIAFRMRHGGHSFFADDWEFFLNFITSD